MKSIIYPSPVYGFLQFISQYERANDVELGRKILDCAAGGRRPPLGLFFEHGFETYGIDISQDQIDLANNFAKKHKMKLNISEGDMREIPFDDITFDFVYEFYSMVHLVKDDIRRSVREMRRVLKPKGFLFIGFMSNECCPIHGEERNDGEFWLIEHGQKTVHSTFKREEIRPYLSGFKVFQEEEIAQRIPWRFEKLTRKAWNDEYKDYWTRYTRKAWESMYDELREKQVYTHFFYILQKI